MLFLLLWLLAAKQIYTNSYDAPSITEEYPAPFPCNLSPAPDANGIAYAVCITGPEKVETCADKSRFLLHSEDGKGHCLSFTNIEILENK